MNQTSVQQIDAWRAAKSENEHLEFKEAKTQFGFDDVLHYCVALGNEGGGNLLLGIANKPPRPVVGTNAFGNPQKTATDLLNKLRFRVDVEEVQHPGGRVLVFHIPSRPPRHPFSVDGAFYMRSGESLVAMTQDQLRKIFNEPLRDKKPFNGGGYDRRLAVAVLAFLVLVAGSLGYKYWPRMHPPTPENHATSDVATAVVNPIEKNPKPTATNLPEATPNNPLPKAPLKFSNTPPKPSVVKAPAEPPAEVAPSQPPTTQFPVAPQTFKDRVIQKNKNSPSGDRERLANAFFEFSHGLDDGSTLMYRGFHEASDVGTEGANLEKDLQSHITKLRGLASSAKEYGKSDMALRTKWSYYPEQTQYVFGDDPDNSGWGKLVNAFDGYANHLETWGAIQNKEDTRLQSVLAEDRTQFESMLNEYAKFNQGCKARLEDMKASIQ